MQAWVKSAFTFLVISLLAVCGCYDDHPSDELTYVCDPGNDTCGAASTCVLAGTSYVCSANDGCPDGCGDNGACVNGACLCFKDCEGMECGLDPLCGISCGTCAFGQWCNSGMCQDDCVGLECGESPHGVNCGGCQGGWWCDSGKCKTGKMVMIPAGSFWMGCNTAVDSSCGSDESPYHQVTLSAYYMDKTEVTVEAYSECVTAGACTVPSTAYASCNWNVGGKEDHPVNCVDWNQPKAYCEWAGKRVPTEAEWEKAARGTDGRKYPWGNEKATCAYAVMHDGSGIGCGTDSTASVCSKSPAGDSPYGLCDMSGNVWEWVSDWYDQAYYGSGSGTDPIGPESGTYRVLRGGSIYFDGDLNGSGLRASDRDHIGPSLNVDCLGFRCAKNAP